MKKSSFRTVLFDFDGVIGNTMDDNFQAWQAAFFKYGVEIKKEDYFLMEGAPMRDVAESFLCQNNLDPCIANRVVQSKERHYMENHHFTLYEGIESLVTMLGRNSFRLGVVSGGNRKRLFSLGINQFLANFDVFVTGDETSQGKPNPEPFLAAARKLEVSPEHCVVIENAPYGITSAKKAGMYCMAVCSTLDASCLSRADKVVSGIPEISDIFLITLLCKKAR